MFLAGGALAVGPGCHGGVGDGDEDDDDSAADGGVPDDGGADNNSHADGGDVGDTDGGSGWTVSGDLSRTEATCTPVQGENGCGGVGTLCVFLLASCGQQASAVASVEVASADLSMYLNVVPYSIPNVPDGTYQLWAFLDDDESGCAQGPGSCDVEANGCDEVTVEGGNVTADPFILDHFVD